MEERIVDHYAHHRMLFYLGALPALRYYHHR